MNKIFFLIAMQLHVVQSLIPYYCFSEDLFLLLRFCSMCRRYKMKSQLQSPYTDHPFPHWKNLEQTFQFLQQSYMGYIWACCYLMCRSYFRRCRIKHMQIAFVTCHVVKVILDSMFHRMLLCFLLLPQCLVDA